MKPQEIRDALEVLGWSERHLARLLGISERTPGNWMLDRYAIPAEYADWLRRMVARHHAVMRDYPPPPVPMPVAAQPLRKTTPTRRTAPPRGDVRS